MDDLITRVRQILGSGSNKFWSSPIGTGLANAQRLTQSAENAPKVNFQPIAQQIQNPVGRAIGGGVLGIVESILNTPSNYVRGITRTGNDLGSMVRGDMRFSPVRLASSAAPTAESILNVASFGAGSQIAKSIGQQTLKQTVKRSALTGVKYGGAFGGLTNLADSRDNPQDALLNTVKGILTGGVMGGVAGGLLGAGGYGIKKVLSGNYTPTFQKNLNNLSQKAESIVKQNSVNPRASSKVVNKPFTYDKNELKPLSERAKANLKFISGDNRIPTSKRGIGTGVLERSEDNPLLPSQSELDRLTRINVKEKVNFLDYIRTPEKVFKKFGMENESKLLRSGYENYQKELKSEIARIETWAKSLPSPESNQKLFKFLDGDKTIELTPQEKQVATEIRQYLNTWADRLDIPYSNRISNYITHIFEKGDVELEFNPDIAKLIDQKVAGSVYNPFMEKRIGVDNYITDTWRALDAYIKRAARKVNLDPALDRIEVAANKLDLESLKYVQRYISRVNMRPTEVDSLLDNAIKQTVGYKFGTRPVANLSRKVRQVIYRATLGLNPGSAIRNLSQGANTYAKLGEKYTIKGYINLLTKGTKELYDVGVLDDGFIQDRSFHAVKGVTEKLDPILFSFFDLAEKINRGSAYFGAKAKALASGVSEKEAIEAAKALVRDTQFSFAKIDTPVILGSDLVKLFTQFSGYSVKQVEFLTSMLANKEFAGLARYISASLLYIGTVGKLIGMDLKEVLPSFRFQPPFMQIGENIKGLIDQEDRVSPKKALMSLAALTLPAGTQLKKTYEGLDTVSKGYSETESGRVRFPVDQSVGHYIRGGLFGQWNLPEAKEYFKNNERVLGEKQSEHLKSLSDKKSAYQEILKKRENDANEDKVKNLVKESGVSTYYGDKYFYMEDGEVKSIDTDFQPTKPKLTGLAQVDKKLISKYKGEITRRENIVISMYEKGLITQEEAEKELSSLKQLKTGSSKSKKAKKIPFIKITSKRVTTPKIKGFKPPIIKVTKPKSVKITNLKAKRIWP